MRTDRMMAAAGVGEKIPVSPVSYSRIDFVCIKLLYRSYVHLVNSWVGELPVWACLGPSAVVGL